MSNFTISGGSLTFISPPDFEDPADDNGDNVYELTVVVTDDQGLTDSSAWGLGPGELRRLPALVRGVAVETEPGAEYTVAALAINGPLATRPAASFS